LASVAFVSNTTGELCTTAATNGLDMGGNREQYRRKAMRTLLLLLSTFGLPLAVFAQAADQDVTLTGTLRGGRIAIGGETTGWTLEYRDSSGDHSVEVELPRELMARARSGARVRLRGSFITRNYVERGAVRLFRVSGLDEVSASAPPQARASAPKNTAARLPQITREELNTQQRSLADDILKVSSVGLGGPYNALLRSPELGKRCLPCSITFDSTRRCRGASTSSRFSFRHDSGHRRSSGWRTIRLHYGKGSRRPPWKISKPAAVLGR
jgi:hypothetical protein